MNGRVKQLIWRSTQNKRVAYILTKTFRIRNNYSLYTSVKKAKENLASLSIYVNFPKEKNKHAMAFFQANSLDLIMKLNQFSKNVYTSYILDDLRDYGHIYLDKPYLKEDLYILNQLEDYCNKHHINLYTVDSNVFVPIEVTSNKLEYSAKTIRNKIWKNKDLFLEEVLLNYKRTIGEIKAEAVLHDFITNKLIHYLDRNDPSKEYTSGLSGFLKYGFISPVEIYNLVSKYTGKYTESFLDEIIIRRELAYNYVYYQKNYDLFENITYEWAYITMREHLGDERQYIYNIDDYIHSNTHDKYFNTAMKEMVYFGKMHSYMRMYWCKKIIEWSNTYKEAYEIAIQLNNSLFIDGNTPNGYAGVAWCFGRHDRAWTEREIFGKLRYMNENGLKRKFDIDEYVKKIEYEILREETK
jgi:deoxyribodipyrimidine photo-lyase